MNLQSFDAVPTAADDVKLSDILAALSHALDLTEGQPAGHCVRATYIGMHVGHALGLPAAELWELYYTIMLKDLGCSSNAARICALYLSDDLGFKRDFKTVSDSLPKVLSFVFSHTGLKAGLAERFKAVLNILQNGGTIVDDLIQTRCQRGAEIAARLRFPPAVCGAIHALDEHWNGKGRPDRLAGPAIPLYARIALLAQVADVFRTAAGPAAALAEVRDRAGTWFDPHLVACFERAAAAPGFWEILASETIDEAVSALEPAQNHIVVDEDYLDDIARAFAQVIDAKSPFTSGHSERVAVYADMIAAELGIDAERRRWLRRAALLHDIGKLGVSNTILDKNGKLSDEEWRDMRAHATLSEAILSRVPAFWTLASIGGSHHERLDGKGYPRGLKADALALETRIVSVADVFDALTADRPYRAAMPIEKAMGILRADLNTAFDPACFAALERAIAGVEGDLARAA
ncbi:HD-GYP domain-containing protein [Methylobacterium persicinum]|uniref:HD-GYP domain-containing protein (C-di-GMP phosphodiesterase class II) n=1 Tax=Methylobacterium persicinum TaxID=374426 RepID=A0ABU0HPD6_9HYPH|nr:HD-GYP domain-containing protein [Methylobacterium persicinum]MDQ0444185.1 HD-GYP domain-containing protein (c-di-GMP phosphodiesterase class II) [Methylobacterium persicinum]GJE39571.1 3'3'-cGAMP-specific phosphodiesterase 3 [Methylobacterium persicinum]